jgi:hypothetical protein
MCLPKGKKTPKPYDNWVESTSLKQGATETALIHDAPVWTSAGQLGPDSDPPHKGSDGGLISKTYRGEAKPLSYAPDVNFEGNRAVRTEDLTSQNHANTVGRVLERPPEIPLFNFLLALTLGARPWKDDILIARRGNVYVVVDKKNKVIVLLGTQEFHGPGATQAYVNRATGQINYIWSGTTTFEGEQYQVRSLITGSIRGGDSRFDALSGATQIYVHHTTLSAAAMSNTNPANQAPYDRGSFLFGSSGTQYSTAADSGSTVAHEFGHSMGLEDEYKEGPRNPDGTRTTIPCQVHPACLMGHSNGTPTPEDYNSLITGRGLRW